MKALAFGAVCAVFAMARSCTPPEPAQQRLEPGSRLKLEHVPSPLVSAWQSN